MKLFNKIVKHDEKAYGFLWIHFKNTTKINKMQVVSQVTHKRINGVCYQKQVTIETWASGNISKIKRI